MSARIIEGDCLVVMPTLGADSFDAIVCDPPYHLTDVARTFQGKGGSIDARTGRERSESRRKAAGFMGKAWDGGDVAFRPETWAAALRVAKPGAHLVAFGGTRTFHRLTCAIEDAGWEIRDCLSWLYGSGFPKSSRVNRDPRFCQCGESGRNGASKVPAPLTASRTGTPVALDGDDPQPSSARRSSRTPEGSLAHCWQDSDRGDAPVPPVADDAQASPRLPKCALTHSHSVSLADVPALGLAHIPSPAQCTDRPSNQDSTIPALPLGGEQGGIPRHTAASVCSSTLTDSGAPAVHTQRKTSQSSALIEYSSGLPLCLVCGKPNADGFGTALKPSWEPIILARKPFAGTVAANVQEHRTGALNIDGCRIGSDGGCSGATAGPRATVFGNELNGISGKPVPGLGRWPANVVLDEEAAAALDEQSGMLTSGANPTRRGSNKFANTYGDFTGQVECEPARGVDTGGASRFFYTAKASRSERNAGLEGVGLRQPDAARDPDAPGGNNPRNRGAVAVANHHPTVKPVALMQWLVRLVTPAGGIVLDPFCGSGSTGIAALREGMGFVGIEREAEYAAIARARITGDSPLFTEVA